MEKNLETIKETTEELLNIMGFASDVRVVEEQPDFIVANIISDEGGFLIGQGGENLLALQHIIRILVFKRLGSEAENFFGEAKKLPSFILDVNDYRQGKIEVLRDLALDRAGQVASERRSFSFNPMSSYERRIIHMALANRSDIICESEGEGGERHIVIRPA